MSFGLLISIAGVTGCSFWRHVAMDAGPRIFLAGLVVSIIEFRKLGWQQALLQAALMVPLGLLRGHVH